MPVVVSLTSPTPSASPASDKRVAGADPAIAYEVPSTWGAGASGDGEPPGHSGSVAHSSGPPRTSSASLADVVRHADLELVACGQSDLVAWREPPLGWSAAPPCGAKFGTFPRRSSAAMKTTDDLESLRQIAPNPWQPCHLSTRSLMSFSAPDPVVSGHAYRVVSVGDSPPLALEQFIGEVSFVVLGDGADSLRIRGQGNAHGAGVRFHEKDVDNTGKDVRIWELAEVDGDFTATAVAAF
jgi:hypothetical protein